MAPSESAIAPVRAILLDVDGTLYDARRLRARMAMALLLLAFRGISRARRTWRCIQAYRRALEQVRHEKRDGLPLASRHLERAAELSGETTATIRAVVDEWLLERPLAYLAKAQRTGLIPFLDRAKAAGLRIGFFSDYPVQAKLTALAVDTYASLMLCGTDPEIDAYKPWPDGFRQACHTWRLAAADVLYIGDRSEVDAIGAAAAGMRCAILCRGTRVPDAAPDYIRVGNFDQLGDLLFPTAS